MKATLKLVILIGLLVNTLSVRANIKKSISNGDWFDVNTWSPVGVPSNEDTLIIETDVFVSDVELLIANVLWVKTGAKLESDSAFGLDGNLLNDGVINLWEMVIGQGAITTNNGEMRGKKLGTSNTKFIQNGLIECDTLAAANDLFLNHGTIDVIELITGGLSFENHNEIIVTAGLTIAEQFLNETGATISSFNLTSAGTGASPFTNDGEVSISNDWISGGTVNGNGTFCVAACFWNTDTIIGTLDICDATPSNSCDISIGFYGPNVTFCASSSPCFTSTGQESTLQKLSIYPNPSTDRITVKLAEFNGAQEIYMVDVFGKLVWAKRAELNETFTIDVSHFPQGIYFLKAGEVVERILKQ